MRRLKLAVIATHPIQYQVPLWQALARDERVDLQVFYASRHGLDPAFDRQFGRTFSWDFPLLDGYTSTFCESLAPPGLSRSVRWQVPRGLGRIFQSFRYDAILAHGYSSGAALAALAASQATGTPLILRGDSHNVGRCQSTLRKTIKELALRSFLKRVAGILAIGTWNHEYWRHFGVPQERMRTALFCVDNDRMQNVVKENATAVTDLRREWGACRDDVFFLFAAKLIPLKRPELLLKAFAELKAANAKLVFVGSGVLEPELRSLSRALSVEPIWAGFVNQSKIPLYYAAADVMVLPSDTEPWGLAVNEAMACGTPCIVSDVVAAGADLIAGKETGAIFRQGDIAALCDRMSVALNAETRALWRSRLPGVIGRATPQVFADELVQLCQTVSAGR